MKREIKFRCWDGEQMVCPEYLNRDGYAWWRENGCPTRSNKVMLFTGLKDKNDNEVYEGDRIVTRWVDVSTGKVDEKPYTIDNIFEYDIMDAISKADEIEVLGNIYENPELIKK